MQPLKRFTQCGSLTMLFVVFIIMFGVSSTALTTFGKSNLPPPPPPTPTPAKGKDCKSQADCTTINKTSCVKDPGDNLMRCLCGDNRAPENGQCTAKKKGLRHVCDQTIPCEFEMVCSVPNATISTGTGFNNRNNNKNNAQNVQKVCLCDTERGYFEDSMWCNGAIQHFCGFYVQFLSFVLCTIVKMWSEASMVKY